jgi:hypothetical protein
VRGGRFACALLLCALFAGACLAADAAPRQLRPGEMLRGRFVQDRTLTGFARPLRSEGSFVLVIGQGLVWQGERPFKSTTVITPAGILQLVNGEEAMRLPASHLPVLNHFYQVLSGALSGDPSGLQQDFRIERGGDPERWRLTLAPARPDDPAMGQVQTITISGPDLVDDVEIRKAGGDVDHLHFIDQSVVPVALSPEEARLLGAVAQ